MGRSVSIESLRSQLDYKDGELYWSYTKPRAFSKGARAGGRPRTTDKYCTITVDGVTLLKHRAIFAWHRGWFPSMVDHIDRDPTNNRIENLRDCRHAQNSRNRDTASKWGWAGVSIIRGKFKARVVDRYVTMAAPTEACILDAATIVNFMVYNYLDKSDSVFFNYNEADQTCQTL
jgi:hypothetical protein